VRVGELTIFTVFIFLRNMRAVQSRCTNTDTSWRGIERFSQPGLILIIISICFIDILPALQQMTRTTKIIARPLTIYDWWFHFRRRVRRTHSKHPTISESFFFFFPKYICYFLQRKKWTVTWAPGNSGSAELRPNVFFERRDHGTEGCNR